MNNPVQNQAAIVWWKIGFCIEKMARKSFDHFSASYKFILALADEPEFKKVYDQRLFDKQIKESALELPDTFFQRFKYFKNEKEIVLIWLFYKSIDLLLIIYDSWVESLSAFFSTKNFVDDIEQIILRWL